MARKANSLSTLLDQINKAFPRRSKSSDGWIGDAAHAARRSDHNPNEAGVVCALDITHDPANGLDAGALADALRTSGDRRLNYVISNSRFAYMGRPWKPYSGSNPHDKHVHVSVSQNPDLYDNPAPWNISLVPGEKPKPVTKPPVKPQWPQFEARKTSIVDSVYLRYLLAKHEEGFGPLLEAQVRAFQRMKGLTVDGIVGPATWAALRGEKK